jgi:hypothetical protein
MNSKRSEGINFRISPEEKEMIRKAAQAFNKNVSGFIRDIILGISSDVIRICSNNYNYTENRATIRPLSLSPPKNFVPDLPIEDSPQFKRGSAQDYKICMEELKRVLFEKKMMVECESI